MSCKVSNSMTSFENNIFNLLGSNLFATCTENFLRNFNSALSESECKAREVVAEYSIIMKFKEGLLTKLMCHCPKLSEHCTNENSSEEPLRREHSHNPLEHTGTVAPKPTTTVRGTSKF